MAHPPHAHAENLRLGHALHVCAPRIFVWARFIRSRDGNFRLGHSMRTTNEHLRQNRPVFTQTGTSCVPQTQVLAIHPPETCPKRKLSSSTLPKCAPNANPRRLLFPEIQSACFSETRSNIYVATNHPVQNASTYALVSHRPRGEPPPSPSYTRSFELLRFEKSRKRSESTRKTLPSDSCFAQILGVDDSEGLALPYASLQDSKGSFS